MSQDKCFLEDSENSCDQRQSGAMPWLCSIFDPDKGLSVVHLMETTEILIYNWGFHMNVNIIFQFEKSILR